FEVIEHDSADSPTPQSWAAAIDPVLGAYSAAQLARSVLVGHSVGSHAILQAIARLPEDVCIGAVVIVAGWWDIDRATWDSFGIPWPDIQRWLDAKLDDQAVRSRTSRIAVLLSDNDPIPASPAEVTAAVYRQRLNATVHIVPERAHFNDAKETAVLTAIAEALAPDFDS
ncbi:MAG: alpha/beta hydrolase, partial [Myxococcota bacterium]